MSETVAARLFVDPNGTVVSAAEQVALRVTSLLEGTTEVHVDLQGVRGVPSSFFNIVLLSVARRFGLEAIGSRLKFRFDTEAQRRTYERSLNAVRDEFAAA